MSDTFDYYVSPPGGKNLSIMKVEGDKIYMEKINWEQIIPPHILPRVLHDKNFNIKYVLSEFMKNNQVSVQILENQRGRLSTRVGEFGKMNEKLLIGDEFIIEMEKK